MICRASFGDTAVSLIQKLACSPVHWFLMGAIADQVFSADFR